MRGLIGGRVEGEAVGEARGRVGEAQNAIASTSGEGSAMRPPACSRKSWR